MLQPGSFMSTCNFQLGYNAQELQDLQLIVFAVFPVLD